MEKEKENWNEKLFVLLNEYDNCWDYCSEYWFYMPWMDRDAYWYHKYYLISKEYWFIQWLVDNDKIDRTYRKDLKYPYYIDDKERDLKGYGKSDLLVMLCSIQDNPIEFLVSILK